MYTIHNEVCNILKSFGYSPKVNEYRLPNGTDMVDISFHVYGYDDFKTRFKDSIRMLAKGYLSEFYYAPGGTQHVYMFNECLHGLEPDDDTYSCLLNELKHVSSEPTENEIFEVSSVDCKRYSSVEEFLMKHVSKK